MPLVALDIAIGLILVYFLLSLVVLSINEGIATLFHLRASMMRGALERLFGGKISIDPSQRVGDEDVPAKQDTKPQDVVTSFYAHPLVKGLEEPRIIPFLSPKRPSYIPASTFVLTLLDVTSQLAKTDAANVAPADPHNDAWDLRRTIQLANLPAPLKQQLLVVIANADGDMERAKRAIGAWFDDAMERVSAGYKARVQVIGLVLAFIVTLAFNANSITIGAALASDPKERAAALDIARHIVADSLRVKQVMASNPATAAPAPAPTPMKGAPAAPAKTPAAPAESARNIPADSAIRIATGYIEQAEHAGILYGLPPHRDGFWNAIVAAVDALVAAPLGLLLTTFAVSLGAPFWFDMLNKVVNIRGAGRAPEERPKSPAALPPARGA